MADEKASFAVELKDDASGVALSASDALKKMKLSIDDDVKALGNMQRAMKQLQSASVVNVETYRELAAKIDAQKNKIAETQATYLRLGGGFGEASKGARDLGERAAKIPGPIGDVARKFGDLREVFKGISARAVIMGAAITGVAVASVALIGGAIFGIGKLFSAAITNADALRSRATRAGGPVMSLSRQFDRMKRDFGKLFSGLNLGPFLRGFREITSMFSQSTVTGRALKSLVEGLLQPLLNAAGNVSVVKRFFQGMIIGALHVQIAILRLRVAFRESFGDASVFHGLDMATVALTAGKAAAAAFVVALGLVGASVGAIALGAYGIYSAFKLVITSATRVLSGVQRLRTQLVAQWRDIGGDIAAGIADGLLRAAIGPVGAITSLGSSMVDALKSALDIHSPSRVFARLGLQIPAGVEQGVERGAPQMNRTVAELVSVPTNRAQVRDAARTVGGTTTVTFGDMHIHVSNDDSDPESIARAVREQVASMLEGAGLAMGVPS